MENKTLSKASSSNKECITLLINKPPKDDYLL
ncbi:hypothetical protein Vi05172_g13284 [Venturia inaequalis]|nr:hypothetical protein Vi05172_g13284 [Venturia inaequalis]